MSFQLTSFRQTDVERLLVRHSEVCAAAEQFARSTGISAAARNAVSVLLERFLNESGGSLRALIPESVSVLSRFPSKAYDVDKIIRIGYCRYARGRYDRDLSRLGTAHRKQLQDVHVVCNSTAGTLATSRGVLRIQKKKPSHLESVFHAPCLDNVSYLEVGRMAAHPVFDVLAAIPELRQVVQAMRVEALKAAIRSQVERAHRDGVPALAILSDSVRAYFQKNRIVVLTPLPVVPIESDELMRLRERYPDYWIQGNPAVYRFTL